MGSQAPLYEYRGSMPVSGSHSVPSLGDVPTDAVRHLRARLEAVPQRHASQAVS
jgi:hypothetical protein